MLWYQKERVRNHIVHWLPARPQASLFSWSSSPKSDLCSSENTNCLLTLPKAHYKIRDVQVLCFHTTTGQISHHPSPASPIHINASKGNSFITNYIHCPKAQAWFPSNVHKTRFQCCLISLSLEFLYSSLARYQAQWKVLAFSQALLANITSHHYVFKDPYPLPPESLKSADHVDKKSSSLPKSNFLILFTKPLKTVIPPTLLTTILRILPSCLLEYLLVVFFFFLSHHFSQ